MTTLYSLAEVSEQNGKDGAKTWIVIRDIVYDVTEYLDDHPGGGELILDVAAKDCTKQFDDFGHSTDAKNLMKKFKIGELVEEDKKANRKKKPAKSIESATSETEVRKKRKKFRFFFCA